MAVPVSFCSLEYADEFLGAHRWTENWTDADESARKAALVNSTQVILLYCKFFDVEGANVVDMTPSSESDEDVEDWLKQACCYEALYFMDLESDPARPFPLGILGVIRDGKTTFDHDYEPPLFSGMARRVLEDNGTLVDDPYASGSGWGSRVVK